MKTRNDFTMYQFQGKVSELLLRHKSILDSLSKHSEAAARVNRAITKTVTNCGCISVKAGKQNIPPEASFEDCGKYLNSHIEGQLCESCREIIEEEIGNSLFYLAALSHLLNFNLEDVMHKEYEKITALGYFHLS